MAERTPYVKVGDLLVGNKPNSDIYKVVGKRPNRKIYHIYNITHDYSCGWQSHQAIKKSFNILGQDCSTLRLLYV